MNPEKQPKVTVIIPSLYSVDKDYLKVCVESLRSTVDWDIIVITNGVEQKPLLDHIKGITVHAHTRDQGQCNAVNIGAQLANPTTEYLFIVNSDMYFAPDWNRNLRFEYSVFSPNLVEPVNNPGSAPPFAKADGGYTLEEFKRPIVDNYVLAAVESGPAVPENGYNFPVFIKKEVWNTIGGYDTNYDPWGSNGDTDLQAKIHLAGIQPKRYRDVLVYHFSNKSGTFDGTHQVEWQKNWDYFTNKWGFNRDTVPNSDVWASENILPNDEIIKYKPVWKGQYASSVNR